MLRNFIQSKLEENLEFEPTADQLKMIGEMGAFIASDDASEIMLLRGYAGTGKTTLLNSLVRTLAFLNRKYVLLAPTGRAAKVLSNHTGSPAWTIHKKIYRQKSGSDGLGDFVLDRNLHTRTTFIVDEASMIGDRSKENIFGSGDLLRDLLEYMESGNGCRLLLAGDTAQLPPVGLEESPALSKETLEKYGYRVREIEMKEIIRQSEDSDILSNATAIRKRITGGNITLPELRCGGSGDVILLSGEEVLDSISDSYDRFGTGETIVLTRSNKRANRFNAGIRGQILWREEELSKGDLLMVVKNNYFWKDAENRLDFIANGDIIRVERVLSTEEVHGYRFAEVEATMPDYQDLILEAKILLDVISLDGPSLDREQQRNLYMSVAEDYATGVATDRKALSAMVANDHYFNALQVKFAYAVTVHKSQGGQWRSVYFDQGYFTEGMLSLDYLRWLYTAFSRASERLYLVNPAQEFFP